MPFEQTWDMATNACENREKLKNNTEYNKSFRGNGPKQLGAAGITQQGECIGWKRSGKCPKAYGTKDDTCPYTHPLEKKGISGDARATRSRSPVTKAKEKAKASRSEMGVTSEPEKIPQARRQVDKQIVHLVLSI